MSLWGRIDRASSRLVRKESGDVKPQDSPIDFWVDITNITPEPKLEEYWDGERFHSLTETPPTETYIQKAKAQLKQIDPQQLIAGNPEMIGRALLVVLIMEFRTTDIASIGQ